MPDKRTSAQPQSPSWEALRIGPSAAQRSPDEPANAFGHSHGNRKRSLRVAEEENDPERRDCHERDLGHRRRHVTGDVAARAVNRDPIAAAQVTIIDQPYRKEKSLVVFACIFDSRKQHLVALLGWAAASRGGGELAFHPRVREQRRFVLTTLRVRDRPAGNKARIVRANCFG